MMYYYTDTIEEFPGLDKIKHRERKRRKKTEMVVVGAQTRDIPRIQQDRLDKLTKRDNKE